MAVELNSLLGPQEVLSSEELLSRFLSKGVNNDAARKLLSRAASRDEVWRSETFKLAGNRRLYARLEFAGSSEFYRQAAERVTQTERKGISRCLALLAKEDVLLDLGAHKLLASPVAEAPNSEKYPSYDDEVLALTEFGIVERLLPSNHSYLVPANKFDDDDSLPDTLAFKQLSRYRIECMLARLLFDSFRRQNVIAWNQFDIADYRKGYVAFNGQVFTAFGYSFLRPITTWEDKKPKSCPVLLELVPGTCEQCEYEGFVERVKRATFRANTQQRYLGILAASDFSKKVWSEAQKQGFWTINLRQVFGDTALDILAQFEILLRAVDPGSEPDPNVDIDSITTLLAELKSNPIVTDLRSIAFETLTALTMRAEGYEDITMGTDAPFLETTRDIDVHGRRGDVAAITECKAIVDANELKGGEVTKFFTETVPAFAKWHRKKHGNFTELKAQLWTTGQIGNEAQEAFDSLSIANEISADIKDREAIIAVIPRQLKERLQKLLTSIAMPTNNA